MSSAESSALHPHEPEVAPILDKEGCCLVCGIQWRDQALLDAADEADRLKADADRLKIALSTSIVREDQMRIRAGKFEAAIREHHRKLGGSALHWIENENLWKVLGGEDGG